MNDVKKILVLGADGMLGHTFVDNLNGSYQVLGTVRRMSTCIKEDSIGSRDSMLVFGVDAVDYSNLQSLIVDFSPDFLINCIGVTKSLCDESNREHAIYINSLLPHLLDKTCKKVGAKLVQFSSDCVFSGRSGSYVESDAPDAIDLYGRSKALGEVISDNSVTIRKSTIGLELHSNHGLIEWFLGARGFVEGFSNAIYSGITAVELVKVVKFIMASEVFVNGIVHVASDPISKYDLLTRLAEILGREDIEVLENQEFHCDRSLNGSAFYAKTGYRVPSWDTMLLELSRDIQKRRYR